MNIKLICLFLAIVGVAQGCKKFASGEFAKAHQDSWTIARINYKCDLEHTQHGGPEKEFSGYFVKLSPNAPPKYQDELDKIAIYRYHCAAVCYYLHSKDHSTYDNIEVAPGVAFEDSVDPEKVTVACKCGNITSDSVNMRELNDVYSKRCVKKD